MGTVGWILWICNPGCINLIVERERRACDPALILVNIRIALVELDV